MARGKAISVKIATPKVIKALETALAKLESDYASQEANEAKYEKARKAWQKEVSDLQKRTCQKSLAEILLQCTNTHTLSKERKCLTQFVFSR
jgi:molecular chaperone GrpE (heat shock protein)